MPAKQQTKGRRPTGPVIDRRRFGMALRAARHLRYSSVEDLCSEVRDRFGVELSGRMIYRYERGEVLPPLDVIVVLMIMLRPPGGRDFFLGSLRDDVAREYFQSARPAQ